MTNVKPMDGVPSVLYEPPRQPKPKPKPKPMPKPLDQPTRFPGQAMYLDTIVEGTSNNKPRPSMFSSSKGASHSNSLSPSAESALGSPDRLAPAEPSTGSAIRKKASKSMLWWGRKGGN